MTEINQFDAENKDQEPGLDSSTLAENTEASSIAENELKTIQEEVLPEVVESKNEISQLEDQRQREEQELAKLLETIEKNESKMISLKEQMNALEERRYEIQNEIESVLGTQEDLSHWIEERRESFAFKLRSKLRDTKAILDSDESRIRLFMANPMELNRNFYAEIRKWFMKRLNWNIFIASFSIGLLLAVKHFEKSLNSLLLNLFDKSFLRSGLDYFLNEILGLSVAQLIFIILGLFFLAFLALLQAYSRRTSEYRMEIAQSLAITEVMEKTVSKVRMDRERIDSLHPQVDQILEILSLGLHSPWKIDEKYLSFEGQVPDTHQLPESVEVASPTPESSKRVFEQLVSRTMNHIQTRRWRADAYEAAISALAADVGFGTGDNSATRELDEDQRRNGKRQILLSSPNKVEVLTSIGDELIKKVAATVQEKVLPLAHPEVYSLRPDELDGLELGDSLVESTDLKISAWEEKLAEIAGLASPWSIATFSTLGRNNHLHDVAPKSIFIASDRVCKKAASKVLARPEVFSGTRPFEVAIRVDLSDWHKPEELAVFQNYVPSSEELDRREKAEIAPSVSGSEGENVDPGGTLL